MRLKEILILGVLSLISAPLVFLGLLLISGRARLTFGTEPPTVEERARLNERVELPAAPVKGGADLAEAGKAFASLGAREADLSRREQEVYQEMSRVTILRAEIQRLRDTVGAERARIEALVGANDSILDVRMKILARTYSSMKPDEAASILLNLDDEMITGILRKITEDRSRAKMMAAMGKVNAGRTARITRLLGLKPLDEGKENKT